MTLTGDSELVGGGADAAAEELRASLDDTLRVVAEYGPDEYNLLYVSDRAVEDQGGAEGLEATTERFHDYVNVDFVERGLYGDLLPTAGQMRTLTVEYEGVTVVRYFVNDVAMFVSTEPDASIDRVLSILDGTEFDHD